MSSSLTVHLLDLDRTHAFIGSNDADLLRRVCEEQAKEMAHDDDWFASEIAAGAPTAEEALRAVLAGGPFSTDDAHGFQYGYAYRRLCRATSSNLSNYCFSPMRYSWLSLVDEALRSLGIDAVSVTDLSGSLPAPLPAAELPGYGEWPGERCVEGLAQWEASTPEQRGALDSEVLEAVEECVSWMSYCRTYPGYSIAGFYS